ncbi:MAG TPA: ATP-binding protein [Candidatus Binataceae bacterium]|nr:ATP-binding protein [Candidatus Binataceae bacterium]
MRDFDWSRTPLGVPASWPQSLKTTVQIMLGSRYAMWMGWGPELTFFYNDAYSPTLGTKHPGALGKPSREVWAEIWKDIGPRIEEVLSTGRATYDEDLMLILHRSGYPEETFHTFSYSPLPDDRGGIGGNLCVVIEDTERVISERRLRVLRDLGVHIANRQTPDALFTGIAASLGGNQRDLPFTMIYLVDGARADLVCSTGINSDHPALPPTLELHRDRSLWPLADAIARAEPVLIQDLRDRFVNLPTGGWEVAPHQAILIPIPDQAQNQPAGVMIAALNPYRPFDDAYRGFIDLMVGQIAAGLADVRAYEREKLRAEALAEIDRAKTAFFSNASHEFRTPLTLMLSPLEDLLARNPTSEAVSAERGQIELIHRNGLRLLKLVNTLLDFSRLEAGRIQATYESVDVAAYTAELASTFQSAMERAGLKYIIDCPPLDVPVFLDRDMWEKIVLNLISNAFKYTLEGEVVVSLGLAADRRRIQLRVRDTGVGIPREELSRLFERFHRIEGQRGRTHEGTGIGLALVQELTRLHGGSVEVTSNPGAGSCFTLSIPIGKEHLAPDRIGSAGATASTAVGAEAFVEEAMRWLPGEEASPEVEITNELIDRPPAERSAAERWRVLVADDNADMRDYIRRLLAGQYEVETVVDGEAALEAVRRHRPDLILSDAMMPRLGGFGLLRAIRAEPALRDIPLVLLSARAGEEASIEGLEAGADDYLVKPFSARELLARIRSNLDLARARLSAARSLEESERRLRSIFADANVGIAQTDLSGRYVLINRKYCEIVGRSMPDLLGRRLIELTHPEDAPRYEEFIAQMLKTGRSFSIELRKVRPDGSVVWISDSASLMEGPDGKPQYVVLIVQDTNDRHMAEERLRQLNENLEQRVAGEIQERLKAEEAFRQAQKMEIIGQLTGGVAHDFNNLLQVILGNLEVLNRRLARLEIDESAGLIKLAAAATRGGQRAANLTQRLLAFARLQPLKPEWLDANKLIAGMSELLRSTINVDAGIEMKLAPNPWRVYADPNQLESAMLNLVVNARDAMPHGGKITIETANAQLEQEYAAQSEELRPGKYVMLAVSDTGIGMNKEVLARAFDPFFTTKEVGHGTGLGLSQVYGFVRQSGGHVKIDSEPGRGTTVRVYLPA